MALRSYEYLPNSPILVPVDHSQVHFGLSGEEDMTSKRVPGNRSEERVAVILEALPTVATVDCSPKWSDDDMLGVDGSIYLSEEGQGVYGVSVAKYQVKGSKDGIKAVKYQIEKKFGLSSRKWMARHGFLLLNGSQEAKHIVGSFERQMNNVSTAYRRYSPATTLYRNS